jgi:hypothetical protein
MRLVLKQSFLDINGKEIKGINMKSKFLSIALALYQDSIKSFAFSPLLSVDKRKPTTNSLRQSVFVVMLGAGSLSMAGNASATLIDSIAALDEGDKYRVLFVTSTVRDATSTNISDYNIFVSEAANLGSVTGTLGLTWSALASTATVDAIDNIAESGSSSNELVKYFNTFGELVASSTDELFNEILYTNLWNYNENGGILNTGVWTGTGYTGQKGYELGGGYFWGTTYYAESGYGISNEPDGNRVYWYTDSNSSELSLYGVSSIATVTKVDVPEPGTVILLSLGIVGLSFSRYKNKP